MTTSSSALARAAAFLAVVTLVAVPVRAQSVDDSRSELRYLDDVRAAIQRAETRPLEKLALARTDPDTSGYDARKYTIHCDVNFANETIQAVTRIDGVATTAALSTVDLDFVGFSISSVTVDGVPATFSRINGGRTLRMALSRQLAEGDAFAIEVAYGGVPTIEQGLGFGFSTNGAATFAEPEGARLWYPCKDRPSDKATYEGFVTVPSSYVVASNGRLVDVTQDAGRKTYHWLESHQIATYLIDFAISNYAIIEDSLGDLPVNHYVYPALEDRARRDFSRTPEMIEAFQTRLGVPYPFDKYGHALFENFGGAMEHQSCTSYGSRLITGDNRYDLVVAHELGHQWFGDFISPAQWEDIWLNEGFATWMESVWLEHHTPSTLPQFFASEENAEFSYEESYGAYPLADPPFQLLFGTTSYEKGGWVVAMLRNLIGDEAFFAGMHAYITDHAYGNARTADFQAAMEAASGRDLSAFFNEWAYGVGYPKYQTSWTARAVPGGHYQLDVRVRQTQATATVFTYPLEIEAVGPGGVSVRQTIDVTSADVYASVCLDFSPTRVTVDPDNRVLGTVTASGAAVDAQPTVCAETPTITIAAVAFSGGSLRLTGNGFVVGDTVVEVNGTELAKTKYPKRDQNPDGSTTSLVGKQKHLKTLLPAGTPVQITVLSRSTGVRSAPYEFTR